MSRLLSQMCGLPVRRRAPRVNEWHAHMVTSVTAWTGIYRTKREAVADAAWHIQPHCASHIQPSHWKQPPTGCMRGGFCLLTGSQTVKPNTPERIDTDLG